MEKMIKFLILLFIISTNSYGQFISNHPYKIGKAIVPEGITEKKSYGNFFSSKVNPFYSEKPLAYGIYLSFISNISSSTTFKEMFNNYSVNKPKNVTSYLPNFKVFLPLNSIKLQLSFSNSLLLNQKLIEPLASFSFSDGDGSHGLPFYNSDLTIINKELELLTSINPYNSFEFIFGGITNSYSWSIAENNTRLNIQNDFFKTYQIVCGIKIRSIKTNMFYVFWKSPSANVKPKVSLKANNQTYNFKVKSSLRTPGFVAYGYNWFPTENLFFTIEFNHDYGEILHKEYYWDYNFENVKYIQTNLHLGINFLNFNNFNIGGNYYKLIDNDFYYSSKLGDYGSMVLTDCNSININTSYRIKNYLFNLKFLHTIAKYGEKMDNSSTFINSGLSIVF